MQRQHWLSVRACVWIDSGGWANQSVTLSVSVCVLILLNLLRTLSHHLSEFVEINETRLIDVDRFDHEIDRLTIDRLAQS